MAKNCVTILFIKRRMVSLTARMVNVEGYRSDNFVVGLTNNDPEQHTPVLWQYTLCGQYPGAVPNAATVSIQCTHAYEHRLRFRYVIVQFPLINDQMNFCEIEVFAVGTTIRFLSLVVGKIMSRHIAVLSVMLRLSDRLRWKIVKTGL